MTLVTTLVLGLSLGAIYALLAVGVTVVYQAARVPNVAIVAIGTVAAVLHGDLMAPGNEVGSGLGWWPALGVAAAVAAGLGLVCDLLTRGLREQIVPALVALLGASAVLFAGVNVVWGPEAKLLPPLWGPGEFGGSGVSRSAVGTLLVATAAGGLVAAFLRRTRLGLALRAAAHDPEGARLAGIDPSTLSRAAWVLSSVLGAVAMTLAIHPVLSSTYEYTAYVAFAFAAAALAGFRSLPRAVIAGLVLGVVPALIEAEQAGNANVGGIGNLVAFLVVAGVVLRRPGLVGRPMLDEAFSSASADSGPAAARRRSLLTVRPRPLPRWAVRAGLIGLALALAVGVPALSSDVALAAWSRGISVFLICASIVIVSGWTGDVPLGQVAFAGVGAYLAGVLSVRAGLPHFAVVPLAALAALPFALVMGIPAFRSRGRLAFAALSLLWMVVSASLFWGPDARWFTGGLESLRRPDWMESLSGREEASYYLVALALAAGVVWFATHLRHSRVGRALAAGRDSDAAARSLGIDPAHYRLVALSFAGVVAALGGVVAAYGEQPPDPTRFAIFLSVQYFLYAVVGGVRSLAGAAVVVFAFEVAPALSSGTAPTGPGRVLVLGGLAALVTAVAPGGLAGLVQRVAGRLAPAPLAVPALASVSAGFTGVRREAHPGDFDPFAAGDPSLDDPYAAHDPFADDPLAANDPFAGTLPDDPFPADPFGPGGPFHGLGDGHGDGDGQEDGRA